MKKIIIILILSFCFCNSIIILQGCQQISSSDTTTVYITSTAKLHSSKIPNNIFEMKNLTTLSINGCITDVHPIDTNKCQCISTVPAEIGNLINLKILNLDVNCISKLPFTMKKLKKLEELSLTDNNLDENGIGVISDLSNLKKLYLDGCDIQRIPYEFQNLKNLRVLELIADPIDSAEMVRERELLPHCKIIYN